MHGLERALAASRSSPSVSRATCSAETPSQQAKSPFGNTGPPVFACLVFAGGGSSAYDVQVLPNHCYVAERRKPGKAIYGCLAKKT